MGFHISLYEYLIQTSNNKRTFAYCEQWLMMAIETATHATTQNFSTHIHGNPCKENQIDLCGEVIGAVSFVTAMLSTSLSHVYIKHIHLQFVNEIVH